MIDQITYCKRCGERYNWLDQDVPENASIYWVPSCPVCNSKETDTAVDGTWMQVITSGPTDIDVEKVHKHARLYHGRLADVSKEGLIERAKWFDERERFTVRSGSDNHDIAFKLRKRAREI